MMSLLRLRRTYPIYFIVYYCPPFFYHWPFLGEEQKASTFIYARP